MDEVEVLRLQEEGEILEVGEQEIHLQASAEEERRRIARTDRMNNRWQGEGLEVRGTLECEFCTSACAVSFPLPYALMDKEISNQKKEYKQNMKETRLNLMILGVNQLWAGYQVEKHSRRAIHWKCASKELQEVFRSILKGDSRALSLPECKAAYDNLTKEVKVTYGLQTESKLINASLVDADKVALPKKAFKILPLLNLLPQELKEVYQQERGLVSTRREDWEEARKVKIALRMPREEYVKILKNMFVLKMVEFRKKEDIQMINGLQCVRKDEDRLRLIFDGRPVNFILQDPPKVDLPGFHLLEGWMLAPDEVSMFGKIDLDNYYHRIGVPDWLKGYLGLPEISQEEISWISEGKIKEKGVGMVCTTLPMGLSHAVFIAQEIHLNLLKKIQPELPINKFAQAKGETWVLVYIDDVLIGVKSERKEEAAREVNKIIIRICGCYEEAGFEVNKDKLKWANQSMIGLGCEFDGKEGAIIPSEKKLTKLVTATRHLISLQWIDKKIIEIILGHWVWLLLLRRPFFSILFNVYRMLQSKSDSRVCKFWESVKKEFKLLIWLAGNIKLSWRRGRSGWLVATDASLTGAGACETRLESNTKDLLTWEYGGFKDITDEITRAKWEKLLQFRWGYQEHINVLEARAVVMSLANILQRGDRSRDRWLFAVDSLVVLGAVRKGRSSSYALNNQLRRILVLCLVANAALDITWVPTDRNPADILSRCFVLGSDDGINKRSEFETTSGAYEGDFPALS